MLTTCWIAFVSMFDLSAQSTPRRHPKQRASSQLLDDQPTASHHSFMDSERVGWTAKASDILEKVERTRKALNYR